MTEYKETLTNRSLIARFNAGRPDKNLKFSAQRNYALQIIQGSEDLRNCTPDSIHNCMLDVAFTGLTLAPSQALLYLIPYGNRATLCIGYRGMEQLAFRTGVVIAIQAALVCESDPVFTVGTAPSGRYVIHEEARRDRGEVTHAYCIASFRNGKQHVEVMDKEQLEAVEEAASKRNKRGGAVWRSRFRGEMQKKAVIRRAWKHWPQDTEGRMQQAMEVLDVVEPISFEGESVRVISTRQVNQLTDLCSEHNIATDTVCRAFGIASLTLLPEKSFDEAVRMVSPV
jgi:phage RecT family recombinase